MKECIMEKVKKIAIKNYIFQKKFSNVFIFFYLSAAKIKGLGNPGLP